MRRPYNGIPSQLRPRNPSEATTFSRKAQTRGFCSRGSATVTYSRELVRKWHRNLTFRLEDQTVSNYEDHSFQNLNRISSSVRRPDRPCIGWIALKVLCLHPVKCSNLDPNQEWLVMNVSGSGRTFFLSHPCRRTPLEPPESSWNVHRKD